MMKMKLLAVVLIFVAAEAAMAVDVINVDIKGYNDNTPYVGNGAYNVGPNAVWTVYYGGWGMPVGSSRSEALVPSSTGNGVGFFCSVYAAQVWLGDNGQNHTYQYGSSLMNDGFVANPGKEPNIAIFGAGAYQGIYDIYVYGNDAGSFRLGYYGTVTTQTVSGGVAAGTFVQGGNYVIFPNVDINDPYSGSIYIAYTNKLNALQFVKKKNPVAVQDGTIIWVGNWDVDGDRNLRTDKVNGFGPDIIGTEPNLILEHLDVGEFMGYDINVNDVNKGRYNLSIDVNTGGQYRINPLRIYLDDKFIGDVCDMNLSPQEGKTTDVAINLFPGIHTVKWYIPYQGFASSTGSNLYYLKFARIGNIAMKNCNEVDLYGVNYPADLSGNCTVALEDLALAANNWLICNNPDPTGCF
ncbi:MAG: hypothetical protein ABSB11_03610 [Sedimentisphaerales bacterium]|jgi:hypothetical protein